MTSSRIDLGAAMWRRSSHSNGDGGNCVEVTHDFVHTATWRKSSHSNGDGGHCVEVAEGVTGVVPVRDSKRPHGPVLAFPAREWVAFVAAVKGEELPR